MDESTIDALLLDFNAARGPGGRSVVYDPISLVDLVAIRDYYLSKRCAALEIILQMCRVARDSKLGLSSSAADGLTDLFSTVESADKMYSISFFRHKNPKLILFVFTLPSREPSNFIDALLLSLAEMQKWTYSNIQVGILNKNISFVSYNLRL